MKATIKITDWNEDYELPITKVFHRWYDRHERNWTIDFDDYKATERFINKQESLERERELISDGWIKA